MQFTRQIDVDYAGFGIRANCVCPGWVDTEMNDRNQRAAGPSRTDRPLPRTDFPSSDAEFVTGTALMVDGGYTAL